MIDGQQRLDRVFTPLHKHTHTRTHSSVTWALKAKHSGAGNIQGKKTQKNKTKEKKSEMS